MVLYVVAEHLDIAAVFLRSSEILRGNIWQARQVGIVPKVGKLHPNRQSIAAEALNVIVVAVAAAVGQKNERFNDVRREACGGKLVCRDGGVLHYIVEQCGDLGVLAVNRGCDRQGMLDIGPTGFIKLTTVGFFGYFIRKFYQFAHVKFNGGRNRPPDRLYQIRLVFLASQDFARSERCGATVS